MPPNLFNSSHSHVAMGYCETIFVERGGLGALLVRGDGGYGRYEKQGTAAVAACASFN